MVVQFLKTTKSAHFFRKPGQLPPGEINALFDSVLASHANSATVDRRVKVRKTLAGERVQFSLLVFSFQEEPRFLDGSAVIDIKHGYLLIAELGTHVAIFKRHVSSPERALGQRLEHIPHAVLSKLFMTNSAEYERVSVKNMAVSDDTLRAASYEARDLKESLPVIGMHRSILRSLRVNDGGEIYGITPTTSKVAKSDLRAPLDDLLAWAITVRNLIQNFVDTPGFIDTFATPLLLADLPPNVRPTAVLLPLTALEAKIHAEQVTLECRRRPPAAPVILAPALVSSLLERSKQSFEVTDVGGQTTIIDERKSRIGTLRTNKQSMTIQSKRLDRISIREAVGTVTPLGSYISNEQDFIVAFSEPQYAYFRRNVFEDRRLLSSIPTLLATFDDSFDFALIDDEKGNFGAAQTGFENRSLFHLVEKQVAKDASIIFCDDLLDEWADHICCWEAGGEQRLGFYHSKHDAVGLSAKNFHEVVSQALKNLRWLESTRDELLAKLQDKWSLPYPNTAIRRIRKGGANLAKLATRVAKLLTAPNTIKEVGLVVSFISKAASRIAFNSLANNAQDKPHVVQLLWLLSSFVHTCRAAGIRPRIICRP